MVSTAAKIQAAFELARRLHEALWMKAIDPQYLSVDELRDVVSDEFAVQIEIKLLDVETKAVYGFIERYADGQKACVYIVKNIPVRWKRLVGVKEICHVVVDEREDWNPDGYDTLQRLVTGPLDLEAEENAAFRSEHIAELVATELLYPFENRKADRLAVAEGRLTVELLAGRYRLPVQIIERVLTPAYMSMCEKQWAAVHASHQAIAFAKAANAG
jgi:Zn-dependent peptidase ImmA (M78 family)